MQPRNAKGILRVVPNFKKLISTGVLLMLQAQTIGVNDVGTQLVLLRYLLKVIEAAGCKTRFDT